MVTVRLPDGSQRQFESAPTVAQVAASIGAALTAVAHGAHLVRVHDVPETIDALKVWNEVTQMSAQGCSNYDNQ